MVLVKSAVKFSNILAALYLCESGLSTLGTIRLKTKIECPTGHVHFPLQTHLSYWPGSDQEVAVFMCRCLYKIKFTMKLPVSRQCTALLLNAFIKYMYL